MRALHLELVGHVQFEVEVAGAAVAALVGGVARLETGETLAAGVAAETQAVGVDVRAWLAGENLVFLAAVFGAEGDVQAAHDVAIEAVEVGIGGQLLEGKAAGIEAAGADALAAGQQILVGDRGVQGVADVVAHLVVAVGLRQVAVPFAQLGAVADGAVAVVDIGVDEGREAVRIHGGRVSRRDVVGADAAAAEGGRGTVAVLHAQGEIQFAVRAGGNVAVDVQGAVAHQRIADDARAVGVGAVGAAAVERLAGDADHAAVADFEAAVGGTHVIFAVMRRVFTSAGHRFAAQAAFEFDVDDAGDGVRAVLGGGAVAQHLHVADRQQGNRVQVGAGVAAVAGAENVHQRRGVAALAVDQHQGLVRTQAAQGGRVDQVGAVGAGLAGRIERGRDIRQGLGQVELGAGFAGLAQGNHIDRGDGVGGRDAAGAARADHVDSLHFTGNGGGGGLGMGGRREGGQGGAAVQAQQNGTTKGGDVWHAAFSRRQNLILSTAVGRRGPMWS